MDTIYSRKRIKIPGFKRFRKVKIALIVMIILVLSIAIALIMSIYPSFEKACKSKASSVAINIESSEVNEVMAGYEYDDLITVSKDENGKITMISAKIAQINEIIAEITSNIKNEIDSRDNVEVEVNLGALSGNSIFSSIGPRFYIKMECSGSVRTNLLSEFTSARNKSNTASNLFGAYNIS